MEPDEAAPVRSLLAYADDTAGGLMTPEPVILPPERHRRRGAGPHPQRRPVARRWPRRSTSCRPPYETPTGRYLGTAHFQRLLREPPSSLISAVVDTDIDPLGRRLPAARGDAPPGDRTTSSPCRSSTASSGCSAR